MDIRVPFILIYEAFFALFLLYRTGCLKNRLRLVAAIAVIAAAFYARWCVLGYETLDYQNFLCHWVDFFRTHGGFAALKYPVGNYNIPYLYFLAAVSYSDICDLYLIKLLSIFFDVILAWSCAKLTGCFTDSRNRIMCVFLCVLCLPTVFLNGSLWGQCDSIYVAFAVLSVYLAFSDRPVLSMVTLACSFAVKLQAVFIIPLFALFLIKGKIKWYHLPVFPAVYVLLVLPAVAAGRPFIETLTLYFSQTGSIGDGLNYNSPSIFGIFWRLAPSDRISKMAINAAVAFMLIVIGTGHIFNRRLSDRLILAAAVLLSVGIPFFLPHMHDRYFFLADIFTLVLAFSVPKLSLCALLSQFASLLGYHAYLKMRYLLQMKFGSWALVLVLISVGAYFIYGLRKGRSRSGEVPAPDGIQ